MPLQQNHQYHHAASLHRTPNPRTHLGASPASTLAHRAAVNTPRGSISPRRARWPKRCKRNCLLGGRSPFPWQKRSGSAPHTRPAVCRDLLISRIGPAIPRSCSRKLPLLLCLVRLGPANTKKWTSPGPQASGMSFCVQFFKHGLLCHFHPKTRMGLACRRLKHATLLNHKTPTVFLTMHLAAVSACRGLPSRHAKKRNKPWPIPASTLGHCLAVIRARWPRRCKRNCGVAKANLQCAPHRASSVRDLLISWIGTIILQSDLLVYACSGGRYVM